MYQWIWQCKHRNKSAVKSYKKSYNHLKHCKCRRKRGSRNDNMGIIQDRVSIERRPKIVNKRARLGDVEVGFMMGKNQNGALLVMTDRATLYTCLQKLETRGSSIVGNAII
jgi:IS30 family transposase